MKEYTTEGVEQSVREALAEQKIPNVLICGQTGVGKSSAINFLFNDSVSKVSDSEPCTRDIKLFKSNYINIYDSEGYEIGSDKQAHYKKMLLDDFLLKGNKDISNKDSVHIVWYTISGPGKRCTDLDINIVKCIKKAGFPVCILITKIDDMDPNPLEQMKIGIKKDLPDMEIFSLSTDKAAYVQKYCNWADLTKWSYEALNDVFKFRFVASLRDGLEEKRVEAEKIIKNKTRFLKIITDPDKHLVGVISAILAIYNIKILGEPVLDKITNGNFYKLINLIGIGVENLLKKIISMIPDGRVNNNIVKRFSTVFPKVIAMAAKQGITTFSIKAVSYAVVFFCEKQARELLNGQEPEIDVEKMLIIGENISVFVEKYNEFKRMTTPDEEAISPDSSKKL